MIKSFWTLLRGAAHEAEQEALDRSALLVGHSAIAGA